MIFYFSGTGNTLWAARQLAEATGESLIDMAACNISSFQLKAEERIGFCFPVHGWQPPKLVRRFIRSLTVKTSPERSNYCFALCTCGDSIGLTMEMLDRELETKGLKLDSMFSLTMPESYVALPFMYTDTIAREQQKTETAQRQLKDICSIVERCESGIIRTHKGPLPWVLSHVIGAFFNAALITDRPFRLDKNRCTACRKCLKICPVHNISLDKCGFPQWQYTHQCTACLACYHHCPKHAINYGPLTRNRGQYYFGKNKNQYSINNTIQQSINTKE